MVKRTPSILQKHLRIRKEIQNALNENQPKGMEGNSASINKAPNAPILPPLCYTEAQAAALLTITIAELIELRMSGKICYRQIGKNIRYSLADLEEYIDRTKTRIKK